MQLKLTSMTFVVMEPTDSDNDKNSKEQQLVDETQHFDWNSNCSLVYNGGLVCETVIYVHSPLYFLYTNLI